MSRYAKGARFERRVKRYLEGKGFLVLRAAGSKPVDLVGIRRGEVIIVECKSDEKNLRRGDLEALRRLSEGSGARPLIATRKVRRLIFLDARTGERIQIAPREQSTLDEPSS